MKTGIFRRSLDLMSLATKVGVRELTSGSAASRVEQAKLIVETLSQLKGAAMKAGQMMSLDLNDYFPPEAIEILSQLQNQASHVDFKVIDEVLRRELGPKYSDLTDLEQKPLAAASIGQVHRAKIFGQNVVLKIQYPGVGDSIESDLKLIQRLAEGLAKLSGRQVKFETVFSELKKTLLDETNYLMEMANLHTYRALIAKDSEMKDSLNTPIPLEEYTTTRVMTMSYEPGLSIKEWLSTNPSMADREWLGQTILKLYGKEFYQWGVVQTDPNLANFLVRPRELCLLDFGATKKYTDEFRLNYKKFLSTVPSKNPMDIINAAVEFELLDPRESLDTKMKFHNFMKHSIEPFFVQNQNGVFNFADSEYSEKSRRMGREFIFALKYTPPPSKLLFLHRKLGGIFALLRKMDLQMDLQPYWRDLVGMTNAPGALPTKGSGLDIPS